MKSSFIGGICKMALVLALALPGVAMAQRHPGHHPPGHGGNPRHGRHGIPEFDPAAAGAIAALLTGGGLLLARRRRP